MTATRIPNLSTLIAQAIKNLPNLQPMGVNAASSFNYPKGLYDYPVTNTVNQELAKQNGVRIIHVIKEGGKGGVTIAWRRSNPDHPLGKMVDVAVAYCSDHDQYTKKIGVKLVLERFFSDNTVQVPARRYNAEQTEKTLRLMFAFSVNIIPEYVF